MMLIVMGESLKNLDKITGETLLPQYPQVDWNRAKSMRDILTHHYVDISVEAVFYTCKEKNTFTPAKRCGGIADSARVTNPSM